MNGLSWVCRRSGESGKEVECEVKVKSRTNQVLSFHYCRQKNESNELSKGGPARFMTQTQQSNQIYNFNKIIDIFLTKLSKWKSRPGPRSRAWQRLVTMCRLSGWQQADVPPPPPCHTWPCLHLLGGMLWERDRERVRPQPPAAPTEQVLCCSTSKSTGANSVLLA